MEQSVKFQEQKLLAVRSLAANSWYIICALTLIGAKFYRMLNHRKGGQLTLTANSIALCLPNKLRFKLKVLVWLSQVQGVGVEDVEMGEEGLVGGRRGSKVL